MNKKIVLLEDDKDLQQIIKYNFSKEKYDVVLCSDGEEALDLITVSYTHLTLPTKA